jgi:hypothetical protein
VVRWVDDLKFAAHLASAFALAAAATVPLLLPRLPAEARSLPLPLPVFCAALAVQLVLPVWTARLCGHSPGAHAGA